MHFAKIRPALLAVAIGVALCACVTHSISRFDSSGQLLELIWPSPQSAYDPNGIFPAPEAVRVLGPGMSRDQVRQILGPPHFREGYHAREWDYILKFRRAQNGVLTCQVKFIYSRSRKFPWVQGVYWNSNECAAYMNPQSSAPVPVVEVPAGGVNPATQPSPAISSQPTAGAVAAVAAPAATVDTPVAPVAGAATAAPPTHSRRFNLSSDTLFAFDRFSIYDIGDNGRRVLSQLADQLKDPLVQKVVVTGYADRLGTAAHNDKLSQRRADAIRDFLVEQGVAPEKIEARARGSSDPVVQCGNLPRSALIPCLSPNRRVTIDAEMLVGR